jgi:DNA modification methylase
MRTKSHENTLSRTGSEITRNAGKNYKRRLRTNDTDFSTTDDSKMILPGNMAYPSNVLHLAAETVNQGHSAPYPVEIPIFFIKALTDVGDVVYDPFTGSGTTGEAALRLDRKFIGSEILAKHVRKANNRILPHLNPIFKTK